MSTAARPRTVTRLATATRRYWNEFWCEIIIINEPKVFAGLRIDGGVIPDSPQNLIAQRRPVPILIGMTKNETGRGEAGGRTIQEVCYLTALSMAVQLPRLVADDCARVYGSICARLQMN
jgi:hypothetical protein